MKKQRVWILTTDHINELQADSIGEQIRRCKAAHHTDLDIRINGQNERHEADWVKHLVEIPADDATVAVMASRLVEARKHIEYLHAAWPRVDSAAESQHGGQETHLDAR